MVCHKIGVTLEEERQTIILHNEQPQAAHEPSALLIEEIPHKRQTPDVPCPGRITLAAVGELPYSLG